MQVRVNREYRGRPGKKEGQRERDAMVTSIPKIPAEKVAGSVNEARRGLG